MDTPSAPFIPADAPRPEPPTVVVEDVSGEPDGGGPMWCVKVGYPFNGRLIVAKVAYFPAVGATGGEAAAREYAGLMAGDPRTSETGE